MFNLLVENRKLRKRCNTLELKLETLEDTIKDELYKDFMAKLGESDMVSHLKEENKKLREERKVLKRMLMEGKEN